MSNSSIIPQKAQKSKPTPKKFAWKKFGFICFCLVWVAGLFIASELLVALVMHLILGEQISQPVWNTVYGALAYTLALILIILTPNLVHKHRLKKHKKTKGALTVTRTSLGFKSTPTWTDIGLGVAGIIAYFILAAIIVWLCTLFCPWMDMNQVQDVGFNSLNSDADRLVAFLALVIIAPIAEEVIFRGWLYGKLRATIPGKWSIPVAMILVSVLFGALHGQWNVAINVFALSLVLCGLREITGTIYSDILVHMIKNGIAFYLLYVIGMGT